MHFQKQTEVKINPGDFAGREAWEPWSCLADQMQVGIDRAVGVASGNSPTPDSGGWGAAAIGLGLQDCGESGAVGGGKAWALGPGNLFLLGIPKLSQAQQPLLSSGGRVPVSSITASCLLCDPEQGARLLCVLLSPPHYGRGGWGNFAQSWFSPS